MPKNTRNRMIKIGVLVILLFFLFSIVIPMLSMIRF